MAQNIALMGAVYSDVPAVELPRQGGGVATFTDISGVNGILKGDGTGNISAAVPNVDYLLPFASSASGTSANFYRSTGGIPVTGLTVDINPIQAGSGDPAPDNVRAITGWSTITVYQSGADTDDYQSKSISLGSTVYGGKVNVTTGELTVTFVTVDMGSLTWTYLSSVTNPFFYADTSDGQHQSTGVHDVTFYCSCLKPLPQTMNGTGMGNNSDDHVIVVNQRGDSYALRVFARDKSYSTEAAFTTAVTGQTLCYPLQTPLTYNLTPTQIASLLGTNNIWADSGEVSVTFGDDIKTYIDTVISSAIGGSY